MNHMYGFVKQCEEKLGETLGRRFFESASQVRCHSLRRCVVRFHVLRILLLRSPVCSLLRCDLYGSVLTTASPQCCSHREPGR